MTSAPQNPGEIPPFQLQSLIQDVIESRGQHFLAFLATTMSNEIVFLVYESSAAAPTGRIQVRCTQALGLALPYRNRCQR